VRHVPAFDGCMDDNQAIVIPETIDAIRAPTAREKDVHASIARINAALDTGAKLI
jgi:glyceraldehyde-3-phosphate dehydrogenase (NAD(P))